MSLTDVAGLPQFRWSSLWYLHRKAQRPPFLRPQTALIRGGIAADDPPAWRLYAQRLSLQLESPIHGIRTNKAVRRPLERGWVLGSEEFKQAMAERDNAAAVLRNHGSQAADELRHRQWTVALENALAALGRSAAEAAAVPKSEPWKLALASWMRASTQASRSWLTARLNLGTPSALSHNLSLFGRRHRSSDPSYARLIALSSS